MKNKLFKTTLILLLLLSISIIGITGSLARYRLSVKGETEALVAKWSIKAGLLGKEKEVTSSDPIEFDLFSETLDFNENPEEDVHMTNGVIDRIAPGTRGKVVLSFINDSEVNAQYNVELSATNEANIPIEYSLDGSTWVKNFDKTTFTLNDITGKTFNEHLRNYKTLNMNGGEDTLTIYWRWVIGDNEEVDEIDTNIGTDANASVKVAVLLNVEQID